MSQEHMSLNHTKKTLVCHRSFTSYASYTACCAPPWWVMLDNTRL